MRHSFLLLAVLVLAACDRAPRPITVEPIDAPAGPGAAEPNLARTADGGVLLSWLEPAADSTVALRVAVRGADGTWGAPAEVVRRNDLFVNWADFPSVIGLADGRLLAHWLQRNGEGRYAYDVRLAESRDGGASWGERVSPHTPGIEAEHGFVAMLPTPDSGAAITLLDGGAGIEDAHGPVMHLAYAEWGARGGVTARAVIDHRVCDCCQTGVALTTKGPVVVYRDRDEDEVRDMSVVRLVDGAWTLPQRVHEDGWRIDFCPVNGPAISAIGDTVAIAWFTGARDTARVQVTFSTDAGASWGAPIRIDGGSPTGRVDLELLDGGAAVVSWIERTGQEAAEVHLREVRRDGVLGAPAVVSASSAARSAGFPRMVRVPEGVVMAWTVPGAPSAVRAALVRVGDR